MKALRKVGCPNIDRPSLQCDIIYSGLSIPMTVYQYDGFSATVTHYPPVRAYTRSKDEPEESLRSPLFSAEHTGRY